ncbi:ABC transporter ATP-binding protein [Dethiosulfovibrio sp. F2B]|uniref:ABC transporter ATP-binding protein n=1 Tax=Dethiosulfovibrio faecalis TaxID=2720018 RepID=UPI001F44ACC2|nr:ABC transporter ATP-binding protein [Dethiosulfovibrio faecalis]MCF4150926.1 ABC transporter ATP-binding protein [Dethiosulfovibrio faecalis]
MKNVIEVSGLCHRYGSRWIYRGLDVSISPGKVYGLLGKNGVGKTTLIKILMGFLRPSSGRCTVFGEDSHDLKPATRARIGLLFEGHLAYDFMTISQIERFYAPHYPLWDKSRYYDLVDLLGLKPNHRIGDMSCGQRSQVVLGLIMAQQPELLILDDYSMGLDAGYRRLFLDYMSEYLRETGRTVFLTSHVIQDMEGFVDQVIFLERGGAVRSTSIESFKGTFHCYELPKNEGSRVPEPKGPVKNVETHGDRWELFGFAGPKEIETELDAQGVNPSGLTPRNMTLEDAFIGYTGRY